MGKNCLLSGLSRQKIVFEQPAKWYFVFLNCNKVGVEENKQNTGQLAKSSWGRQNRSSSWFRILNGADHSQKMTTKPNIQRMTQAYAAYGKHLALDRKQLPGIQAREKKHLLQKLELMRMKLY